MQGPWSSASDSSPFVREYLEEEELKVELRGATSSGMQGSMRLCFRKTCENTWQLLLSLWIVFLDYRKAVTVVAGPLLALLVVQHQSSDGDVADAKVIRMAAISVWMSIWWLTEVSV